MAKLNTKASPYVFGEGDHILSAFSKRVGKPVDIGEFRVKLGNWTSQSLLIHADDLDGLTLADLAPYANKHGYSIRSTAVLRLFETLKNAHPLYVRRDVRTDDWTFSPIPMAEYNFDIVAAAASIERTLHHDVSLVVGPHSNPIFAYEEEAHKDDTDRLMASLAAVPGGDRFHQLRSQLECAAVKAIAAGGIPPEALAFDGLQKVAEPTGSSLIKGGMQYKAVTGCINLFGPVDCYGRAPRYRVATCDGSTEVYQIGRTLSSGVPYHGRSKLMYPSVGGQKCREVAGYFIDLYSDCWGAKLQPDSYRESSMPHAAPADSLLPFTGDKWVGVEDWYVEKPGSCLVAFPDVFEEVLLPPSMPIVEKRDYAGREYPIVTCSVDELNLRMRGEAIYNYVQSQIDRADTSDAEKARLKKSLPDTTELLTAELQVSATLAGFTPPNTSDIQSLEIIRKGDDAKMDLFNKQLNDKGLTFAKIAAKCEKLRNKKVKWHSLTTVVKGQTEPSELLSTVAEGTLDNAGSWQLTGEIDKLGGDWVFSGSYQGGAWTPLTDLDIVVLRAYGAHLVAPLTEFVITDTLGFGSDYAADIKRVYVEPDTQQNAEFAEFHIPDRSGDGVHRFERTASYKALSPFDFTDARGYPWLYYGGDDTLVRSLIAYRGFSESVDDIAMGTFFSNVIDL